MRSAKQFWDEARRNLGYTREEGYREDILYRHEAVCCQPEEIHARKCEALSRRIAIETGQAKEMCPGMITFKHPSGIGQIHARCWIDPCEYCNRRISFLRDSIC